MKFLSRKFLTTLAVVGFNLYLLYSGSPLPEAIQEQVLIAINSIAALYVVVQGFVDSKQK